MQIHLFNLSLPSVSSENALTVFNSFEDFPSVTF